MSGEIESSGQTDIQSDSQNVPNTQTHVHQVSAFPGEWAVQRLLGPTLDAVGADLQNVYEAARNKLLNAALRKTPNVEDGKRANIRVAHGVLTSGAFSDSEICAEYFGGILAASRTEEGQNDDAIQFVEVTKSLSSKQLHLHYVIYNRLNKLFVSRGVQVNVAMGKELDQHHVCFSTVELGLMNLKVDTDLNILHNHGLVSQYGTRVETLDGNKALPYSFATPSTFGVLLYAVSHNQYANWHQFNSLDFGDYEGIALPSVYASNLDDLKSLTGVGGQEK
jgi:hypothetical protein